MPRGRSKNSASDAPSAKAAKAEKHHGNGANLGFEAQLFLAADKLRKNLEPSDYKHVALGLIFLKYISNAFEAKRTALLAEDLTAAEDPDKYLAENIFWVPKEARWSHLQDNAKQPTIGKLIDDAMSEIEKSNPGLKGVLPKDYNRPALDKVMLGELIDLVSGIGMGEPGDRAKDILGRVYEYFLGGFAGSEGKRGGEFYTPRSVVRVLVAMLEPYKGRIYDPCCGSLTADRERFMPWRTVMGDAPAAKGTPELETVLKGVFDRRRFLDLVKDFIVFGDTGSDIVKIFAGYHQFHAVRKAVEHTLLATAQGGDRKVGVIWHTQGSGKSLLMAFYAGQIIKHPAMKNPTLVVLTDRNDLDDQLFGTFSMCKDLLRQTPQQAEDREHLRNLLDRPSGGVIFTTLQKFSPEDGTTDYPALTDRRNVIVIADEAHRSQYGFRAKVEGKTGKVSYGFAKYLRDGLPNASFIGFTGTPIEADDVNTPAVFGDYIDIYDISRAVEDGATVPIYYESRLARIELDEDEKPKIDAEIADLTEDEAASEQERLKRKWASVEALVGSDKRLALVAADLVKHFEDRAAALDGKAMIVCMSRRICVALYDAIVKLRPQWHSDDDEAGAIKVVMTGAASDSPAWQAHIGKRAKSRRELIAKRAKDANDALNLVIVRDMWLTGFDAPCMHTMYVDKPMKGHGLMQAIARVNRVFRDKPAGLVVDYIGIAQNLKSALGQYAGHGGEQVGIDEAEAVRVLSEKYEVVRACNKPMPPKRHPRKARSAPTAAMPMPWWFSRRHSRWPRPAMQPAPFATR